MKSNMTAGQKFAQVPKAEIQRSSFNRDHSLKTTFDADKLVPIFCDEVLPGDTHKLKENTFGRLATPINPIMDNMKLSTFYFFVPMRLVWDNYYKFFGGQDDPGDSTDFQIPKRSFTAVLGSIGDHFGLPPVQKNVNILPFRAYWLIYDEWFRDQNLQNSAKISRGDGSDIILNTTDYSDNVLATRGKRHDYFTSCLPWAQKGDDVQVPITGQAPIFTNTTLATTELNIEDSAGVNRVMKAQSVNVELNGSGSTTGKLYADLTQATSATINSWRTAFQIQKFLERDARSGTRYTEKIKAHFGVSSPDSRLQRPEYLGGTVSSINVHPVTQTSSTDATTPQGNLSAFGTVSSNNNGFTKSFTEHGFIIGLANVSADLTYSQGVDKMWLRDTQYDYFWPAFQNLGEQVVLNEEIYIDSSSADGDVFGYQERYAEYKYKKSLITGLFRSSATASLDAWHLSQEFSSHPTLGDTFIKSDTPVDRVIAVPAEPHLILDCFFNYTSIRPMPVFSPPGMIDHF